MTLREFREYREAQGTFDSFSWGGCGCFTDDGGPDEEEEEKGRRRHVVATGEANASPVPTPAPA